MILTVCVSTMTEDFFEKDTNEYVQSDELNMSTKDKKTDSLEEKASELPADQELSSSKTPDEQPDRDAEGEVKPEQSIEEKLAEELTQIKDRYVRLLAEFDNYKKISQREQQNSIRFANESLLTNLLPIIDNLEQAIVAQKKSSEEKNDILIGLEMVLKQLFDLLNKYGVEVFNAKGIPFDPARHEALSEQEDETAPPGTVVIEYQKGYLLNGRLLRPARVAVAKKPGNV